MESQVHIRGYYTVHWVSSHACYIQEQDCAYMHGFGARKVFCLSYLNSVLITGKRSRIPVPMHIAPDTYTTPCSFKESHWLKAVGYLCIFTGPTAQLHTIDSLWYASDKPHLLAGCVPNSH